MKVKVLVPFYDKKELVMRPVGSEFELTEERFEDLNQRAKNFSYGAWIEKIESKTGTETGTGDETETVEETTTKQTKGKRGSK